VSTSLTSSRTYPDRLEDPARRLQAAMAISSNPLSSTTQLFDIARFSVSLDIPDISGACARGVQNKT
jgi:hypothetical protein